MITRDAFGVIIHYTDANGNAASVSPLQATLYSQLCDTQNAQQQAITDNQKAVANYNGLIASYNGAIEAGRPPQPLPPAPQQTIVPDIGTPYTQPFPAGTFLAIATAPATLSSGMTGLTPTYNSDALSVVLTLLTQQATTLGKIAAALKVN